ncbi:DUF4129 domain-containing protein [Streptomyces sp. NPDC058279]|uniref:DUF4129 domain-containing protein n=1 Tax=Streptomyces sp. NPDC058279 TaxID=3346418 RepID=UPI0036EA32B7
MSTGGLIITAATPPVTTPRDAAREAAERELSKPLYHQNDPSPLQRVLDRLWDWLGDFFDRAAGSTPGGTVGLVAVVLLAIAAIGALWWRLGTPRRAVTGAGTLFEAGARTAADHRAAADAHAAAGRWTEAVQERMRAVVRSLEERTLLDPRPGRTADEAAAEAAHSLPHHADELRAAAHAFDDVTYGGRTGDPDIYGRLRTLDLTLERATPLLTGPTA